MNQTTESLVARRSIGANQPPLADMLGEAYLDLLTEFNAWFGSASRAPATVENDTDLTNFGTIITKLRSVRSKAKKAHEIEKAPFLENGRIVDKWFNNIVAQCETAELTLARRQSGYLKKKEDDARKAAESAAAAAALEAAAKLREAERLMDTGDFETAQAAIDLSAAAETTAKEATKTAEAKPADLVRTYASSGTVVSSQAVWRHTIVDKAKIPLDLLRPFIADSDLDKYIKAFVRNGGRQLAGVTIEEDRKPINR